MKISAAILAVFVGTAHAGKPNLSITVKDGSFGGLDGFDPKITLESSGKAGDVDLEYGIEGTAADVASLPTMNKIWGRASTTLSGWGVSAKAEIDPQDTECTDIDIDASNDDLDLTVRVEGGVVGSDFTANNVEVTKGIDTNNGGRITINRRNNIESGEKDIVVTYSEGSTDVKITASSECQELEMSHKSGDTDLTFVGTADGEQEITVSQQIDDDNRVAPTISRSGDLSIEWEKSLGGDNSLTTTLKPSESLGLEWKDAAWTATVDMPLDGNMISGATVSIQRDVDF